MASLFEQEIQTLTGVGEKRAKLFHKLGVFSVGALLRFYPRTYEDWSQPLTIEQAPFGVPCAIRAVVLHKPIETRIRKGMTLYKTSVTDGMRDLQLTFFNNPYIVNALTEGKEYIFYGKVSGTLLRKEMSVPEFYPVSSAPSVCPIYRQTEGLSTRMVSNAVKHALALLPEQVKDPIPYDIRMQHHLCELRYALEQIHFPDSMESMKIAKKRLVFEELFTLQLGLLELKYRKKQETSLPPFIDYTNEFFRLLPFTPTGAQKRAISEAMADMTNSKNRSPMSRLVQGDVGSGKTAVAAALCYSVIKNGVQAALMAPTEILAQQHYASISDILKDTGISVGLLTGSVTPAKKGKLIEQLQDGSIQMVIGTHALISETVAFKNLGLVITDEQHRFGVAQRSLLAEKGNHPHMLVMSATPIPRTLALIIYGDLDISVLDELPPGRQTIETYAISSRKRARALQYIRTHLDAGQQAYIICPLVEESTNDMASVVQYANALQTETFPDKVIGILHGKMKPKEKDTVMTAFANGKIDVLVSTTVVEVGVDVPNAVIILIENAERYGLSQLHQLRGRVGRGTVKSTCILVSDAQNEEAVARLKILCSTSDGFRIADEDLRLRGPGDFFGEKQHGLPDLKIANMAEDMEVLKEAQSAARHVLSHDPKLEQPEHRGLKGQVKRLFSVFGGQGFH